MEPTRFTSKPPSAASPSRPISAMSPKKVQSPQSSEKSSLYQQFYQASESCQCGKCVLCIVIRRCDMCNKIHANTDDVCVFDNEASRGIQIRCREGCIFWCEFNNCQNPSGNGLWFKLQNGAVVCDMCSHYTMEQGDMIDEALDNSDYDSSFARLTPCDNGCSLQPEKWCTDCTRRMSFVPPEFDNEME